MRRAVLVLIMNLTLCSFLFGEEDKDRPITEDWKEVLLYGIDSEIIRVIKNIKEADERSLNKELLSVFEESLNPKVRREVLDFFGRIEYIEAEDTALALLGNEDIEDPELITSLIRYLAALNTGNATKKMIELIDHENTRIAESAVNALGKSGSGEAGKLILEKLADADFPEELRTEIVLALGELKYGEAVDTLIRIASDGDEEKFLRMYAAISLGKIGDEQAIPVLKGLFSENDSLIRAYAASALANFAIDEVENILIQGLKDSNVRVRIASAEALARKEAKKAVNILIYKAEHDPEKKVRLQALKSLGEIGTGNAFAFLKESYLDKIKSLWYREASFDALADKNLNAVLPAVDEVIETEWESKDQKALEFTGKKLAQLKGRGLKRIFQKFLESKNMLLRIYGIRGITKNQFLDLKDKIKTLSTEDPHSAVRQVALSALEKL